MENSEIKVGTVEKIEYTTGSFGNQFTTIDGHRYWTWWDIRSTPVRLGAKVRFRATFHQKVWDQPLTYGDVADSFEAA